LTRFMPVRHHTIEWKVIPRCGIEARVSTYSPDWIPRGGMHQQCDHSWQYQADAVLSAEAPTSAGRSA
jgi:hypothetical protein